MERFGEVAVRLCNVAALMLGWRPQEFWDATPTELATTLEAPACAEWPDAATIEALKQRFPDRV